jgi:hypothetical protein
MTIHQPRSNIYALFDQLVLLAQGKCVYSGPAQDDVINHFTSLGYECPLGFNIADYLIDLTMHAIKEESEKFKRDVPLEIVTTDRGKSPSRLSGRSIRDEQEDILYSPKPTSLEDSSPNHASSSQQHNYDKNATIPNSQLQYLIDGFIRSSKSESIDAFIHDKCDNPSAATVDAMNYSQSNTATWWTQFNILSARTFKNLVRNPELLKATYMITFFVAVLCGSLFWKVELNLSGFQNRLGVFFFICALFGFQCLGSIQVYLYL